MTLTTNYLPLVLFRRRGNLGNFDANLDLIEGPSSFPVAAFWFFSGPTSPPRQRHFYLCFLLLPLHCCQFFGLKFVRHLVPGLFGNSLNRNLQIKCVTDSIINWSHNNTRMLFSLIPTNLPLILQPFLRSLEPV